jgi:hypothetical protein
MTILSKMNDDDSKSNNPNYPKSVENNDMKPLDSSFTEQMEDDLPF